MGAGFLQLAAPRARSRSVGNVLGERGWAMGSPAPAKKGRSRSVGSLSFRSDASTPRGTPTDWAPADERPAPRTTPVSVASPQKA
eukprot:gene2747-4726_t